jgi:hypothetical protein
VTAELRLRELLDRLVAADVRFVIIGGLAVNAWGHVRGTQDVDLVPDPDPGNLERLASVLMEADGRVETAQGRLAAAGWVPRSGDERSPRFLGTSPAEYLARRRGQPTCRRLFARVTADAERRQVDSEDGVVDLAADAGGEEVVLPLVRDRRPGRRGAGDVDIEPA